MKFAALQLFMTTLFGVPLVWWLSPPWYGTIAIGGILSIVVATWLRSLGASPE